MAHNQTCARGHHWISDDTQPVSVCPVCMADSATWMSGQSGQQGSASQEAATLSPGTGGARESAFRVGAEAPGVPGYEIIDELGRGAMGVVYKARQTSLKRVVALKMVLAGGHASIGDLKRFQAEAEAVAQLQHPNIVQVHEIGQHDGRPYFSLEFCAGGTLKARLSDKPLEPDEAARLVACLAQAMDYAHQRGIIHRDLKPANILLQTGDRAPEGGSLGASRAASAGPSASIPKIADFGLAKKLDAGDHQTHTGAVIGTPSYMAPEQAQGDMAKVGPAADIYALGAILYEALTGRPPFKGATTMDTLMLTVNQDPVAPRVLQPKVPRDLETICLKCLNKEPSARYLSAADLADDLGRYVAREPIAARPTSAAERAWKWACRRPALVALAFVSLVAAATMLYLSAAHGVDLRIERDLARKAQQNAEKSEEEAQLQRRRATENLGRALHAVDSMLVEVADEHLVYEPRMEKKRKALLAKALEFYREFLSQEHDDPLVRKDVAEAHLRFGDTLRQLGEYKDAVTQYDAGIQYYRSLVSTPGKNETLRAKMAACFTGRGEALRAEGNTAEALTAHQTAHKMFLSLIQANPNEPDYRKELARTLYNLGLVHQEQKALPEAETSLRKAIETLDALIHTYPDRPAYQQDLARSWLNLAPVLRTQKNAADAKQASENAIRILTALAHEYPDHPEYRHELGVALNNFSILLKREGTPADADAANRRARELLKRLTDDYPSIPEYRKNLAIAWNSYGLLLAEKKDWAEAQSACEQARDLLKPMVAEFPDNVDFHGRLGMVLGNLGWMLLAQEKDLPRARDMLNAGMEELEKALQLNSRQVVYRTAHAEQQQFLMRVLKLIGPD
jgi:eukaryotic-like serine/threonine-protein kinase